MKRILLSVCVLLAIGGFSQTASLRITQFSFSNTDPDAGGPAKGSVVIQFEILASAPVTADGMGLSFVYQSSNLIPTSSPTTVKVGALAAAASWNIGAENYAEDVTADALVYGGRSFDRRMFVSFNQSSATDNLSVGTSFMPVAQVTFWTTSTTPPEGGYATPQPGSTLPQIELVSDNGATERPFLSPNLNSPITLSSGPLPVLFTNYSIQCNDKGALLTWGTATESNSSKFEIQRSKDGNTWVAIDNVAAAGISTSDRKYQYLDLQGGSAFYRVRQIDLDGKSAYTAIAHSSCESKNFTVVLYPVPVKENLTVVIRSDKSIRTDLQIIDINGKLLRRIPTQINNGNNNISIDVKDLAAGQYLLTSSDPDVLINKRFVIAR